MKTALIFLQSRLMLRIFALTGLLVGIMCTHLEARATKPSPAPDIQQTLITNFRCLTPDRDFKFEVGVTQFVPLSLIKASQPSFTAIKIIEELQEAVDKFGVDKTAVGFAIRDGRSVYPPHKKAIGVVYNDRVYLLDGHHKAIVSLYFSSPTMPVEIIADWTKNSKGEVRTEADFREKMIHPENAYAYPLDAQGTETNQFFDLCELKDDPNLYLARLLIQKVKAEVSLESLQIRGVGGSSHPLILKLNEGVPFLELYIAATLKRGGIDYKTEWGKLIPERIRRQIRDILAEEVSRPGSPIERIILLEDYADLPTNDRTLDRKRMKIIYKHLLNRIECDDLLTGSTD